MRKLMIAALFGLAAAGMGSVSAAENGRAGGANIAHHGDRGGHGGRHHGGEAATGHNPGCNGGHNGACAYKAR